MVLGVADVDQLESGCRAVEDLELSEIELEVLDAVRATDGFKAEYASRRRDFKLQGTSRNVAGTG